MGGGWGQDAPGLGSVVDGDEEALRLCSWCCYLATRSPSGSWAPPSSPVPRERLLPWKTVPTLKKNEKGMCLVI